MDGTYNKKQNIKRNIVIGIMLGAILATHIFWLYLDYKEDIRVESNLDEVNNRLQYELVNNTNCKHTVDSLNVLNDRLSIYESLTLGMVHRDEATKDLKYGVGDIVLLKSDSSRVVIEDVLIGGGKYNYFIKYKVLFKDDTRKEVTPEMVF